MLKGAIQMLKGSVILAIDESKQHVERGWHPLDLVTHKRTDRLIDNFRSPLLALVTIFLVSFSSRRLFTSQLQIKRSLWTVLEMRILYPVSKMIRAQRENLEEFNRAESSSHTITSADKDPDEDINILKWSLKWVNPLMLQPIVPVKIKRKMPRSKNCVLKIILFFTMSMCILSSSD